MDDGLMDVYAAAPENVDELVGRVAALLEQDLGGRSEGR